MNNNVSVVNRSNVTKCITFPVRMHSLGIWEGEIPSTFPLPALEMQIVVVFILTQLLHYPLKIFRFPKILAEIIAGVILGPTMPDIVTKFTYKLFPFDTQETITTLSMFGYTFLLFLIGVKSDVTLITKTGKKAIAIGILTLILPFSIGFASTSFVAEYNQPEDPIRSVVAMISLSSFSGIVLLLRDLKLLNSELGRLALSSAAISEFMNVTLILSLNLYQVHLKTSSAKAVCIDLGLFVCFLLLVFLIIRPGMVWIVKRTPEGRDVRNGYLYAIIALALLCCLFTHFIDQYALLGAFVMGLAVPDGPPMGSRLVDNLDSYTSGLLVPVFVTINSSRADLRSIFRNSSSTTAYVILIPLVFFVKLAAGVIPAWICKVPFRDALALGLIMCTKGVVEIASNGVARDNQVHNESTMAVMIITIAVTAAATTITVRKLYDPKRKYAGYQSRNIMHSKMDGELRVLACLHRPDNINGFINLIDASGPTEDTPMTIFVLHLIELHGRASPIFISHQLQKKNSSGYSYSEDILLAFGQFERAKEGAITTQCFTAISPRKLMYDDICTLALDKLTSLLIIPFHRKWDFQGSVEAEDNALRSLNEKILDRSPCSVGIFIDRGLVERESSYSVAMIFFGGSDDREALTYAKRIARSSGVSLTVIRFVAADEDQEFVHVNKREKMLDDAVLKDVKMNNIGTEFVYYEEEKVKDGPETALVIRSMINEFDLVIVGRRNNIESTPQTSGLSEWSEFPELGVIGDFLGSMEGKWRASVLVIQQQKQMTR